MSDAKSKIAKALMKDPEWEYGSILPIATRGPRKSEGETYGDISLALPDIIRDPLASWTKIRDQGFTNYDMSDVLNVSGMMAPASVVRGAVAKSGLAQGSKSILSTWDDLGPPMNHPDRQLWADAKLESMGPQLSMLAGRDASSGSMTPLSGNLPSMQRAAEQGFDPATIWYRGTLSDRPVDALRVSDKYNAVYAGDNPKLAGDFAWGDNGKIVPLLAKSDNIFDPSNARHVDRLMEHLGLKGETDTRKAIEGGLHLELEDHAKAIKELGFRGYRASEKGDRLDSIAMFDPADFRSPWAQFDPANAGKNGLLLEGSGPIAAIAAALNGQEDRR